MSLPNKSLKLLFVFIISTLFNATITVNGQTTFAIIGDFGSGNSNETEVATLVSGWNPEFVITTGDNRYNPTNFDLSVGRDYCKFLAGASTGHYCNGNAGSPNAFFPSTGNHEYSDGGGIEEYLNYFDLPGTGVASSGTSGSERFYDFIQGPVHFFVIDSYDAMVNGTEAVQQSWLQSQMAASLSVWKIVYFHHAPYSSSASHGSTELMRWPFAQWGADAVISGHDHTYERLNYEGISYFVNGLGGMSKYSFSDPLPGSIVHNSNQYGAQKVVADNLSMTFSFIDIDRNSVDEHTIYKTNPSDNTAPVFLIDPIINLPEGQVGSGYAASISSMASDSDGDRLFFSKISGPDWLHVEADGSLTGNPLSSDIGLNLFSVRVTDDHGGITTAGLEINVLAAPPPPPSGVLDIRISDPMDDVEERATDGYMYFESSDIELGNDPTRNGDQTEGFLFRNISIPQGAFINSAYIEFETDEKSSVATTVLIRAHAADHAPGFSSIPYDLTSRVPTNATVTWDIPAWDKVDEKHQSPDLSLVIQELINREGWIHYNNIAIIIDGSGNREAEAYEGEAAAAALLHLEYSDVEINHPPSFNSNPVINTVTYIDVPYSNSIGTLATDPDGDDLTFSKLSGPAWLLVDANGSLSGTPTIINVGPNNCNVQVSDGIGGFDEAMIEILVIDPSNITYCTSTGNATEDWIASVTLGDDSHSSGASGIAGYENFTGLPVFNLESGSTLDLLLEPGFASRSKFEYWTVWIDYNVDGDFNDSGEKVFSSSKKRSSVTGIVTIPDIPLLETTMRVSMKRGSSAGNCEFFSQGEVEDYTIVIAKAVPVAPVANFNSDKTTISTNEVVHFTDQSTNNPDGWSWSFDGGSPAISTDQHPVVSYANTGSYDVTLEVSNNQGSDTKSVYGYIIVSEPSTEYCTSSGINTSLEWIESVVVDGTPHQSVGGSGYSDFSNITFLLSPGTTIPITLTPDFGKKAQREYWRIWIDYNNDSDFDDEGEEVFAANNSRTTVNGQFFVPPIATGPTKMRVSMNRGSAPLPCGDLSRGEVEDYTVAFSATVPVESTSKKSAAIVAGIAEDELTDPTLSIYPNPVSEKLIVQMKGWEGEKLVQLISITGKILFQKSISNEYLKIDTDLYPNGLYILKVENGVFEEFERIILQ